MYVLSMNIGGIEGGGMDFATLEQAREYIQKHPPEENHEMIDEIVESLRDEYPDYVLLDVLPSGHRKWIDVDELIDESDEEC